MFGDAMEKNESKLKALHEQSVSEVRAVTVMTVSVMSVITANYFFCIKRLYRAGTAVCSRVHCKALHC
jgi:hypothetical protein